MQPEEPRAAVLAPTGIVGPSGAFAEFDISAAEHVLAVCRGIGVRQLWIGHGARERLGLPAVVQRPADSLTWRHGVAHPWIDDLLRAGWRASSEPAGFAPWLELQRGEEYFDVVLPSWDADNPFGLAPSAGALLEALGLFSGLLRHRYRRSPGATGLSLMRAVHTRLSWPEAHLPPVEIRPREPVGLWLTPDPIPAEGWLHGFDLNGMYLAACSSAELGFGEPVRAHEGPGPGYVRASITAPPGPLHPLPFVADGKPHWYAEPALELAAELGARISPLEAWIYPERHRWLEPWYGRLRDARAQLLERDGPAAGLALAALKAVYTRTIGRLAGSWLEPGEQTFRPDWRDAVIARARANMYRHLVRVADRCGAWPVAVNADAVIYHLDEPDPGPAAAQLGLEVSAQLGKWKHAGTAPARAAAPARGESPSRRARRLFEEELH